MKKILPTCLLIFCLGLGIGAGVQLGALGDATFGDVAIRVDDSRLEPDSLSNAFRKVSRRVAETVVSIESVSKASTPVRGGSRGLPPEFRDFFENSPFGGQDPFGDLFPAPRGNGNQPQTEEYVRRGTGTGFIVSSSGVIVTNNHVVRQANEIRVTLSDGRTMNAELVGADAKTDVAVLRVDADDLPAATFGDSDLTEVGEWVLAIGGPFGLDQTVTAGIISATSRGRVGLTEYEDFIQTDAAINPGNSGGPLVDLKGRVIGMNTAIASASGASMGVGFAIPSNMVRSVVESILETGEVSRGQLGAMISDLTPELAESFGFDTTQGVLINDVLPGTAADKAGLKAGDIVTHLDGRPMTRQHQLRSSIARSRPGTEATLTVFRNGKTREFTVRLGKLDESKQVASRANNSQTPEAPDFDEDLGVSVAPWSEQLAEEYGLSERFQDGLVVTAVKPGSPAAGLGIRAGDIIVQIGSTSVKTAKDLKKAMSDVDLAEGFRLQMVRNGVRQFLFYQSR